LVWAVLGNGQTFRFRAAWRSAARQKRIRSLCAIGKQKFSRCKVHHACVIASGQSVLGEAEVFSQSVK
jgi:hypothetical protein